MDALEPAPFLERAEVAGPGFVNLFTTDDWLHDALREVVASGETYGRADPHGRRAQVEFVSANPTGPLTLGHARNAAIGDALARLLEADRLVGRARVLFQRRRRTDGSVRSLGRGAVPAAGGPRGRGARRRVPRRVRRGARPRDPGGRGARARRPPCAGAVPAHARGGRGPRPSLDRGDARAVRRAVRRLLPGVGARSQGRDRRGGGAAAPERRPPTRPRAPPGSARRTTATTRIGWSSGPTVSTRTSARMPPTSSTSSPGASTISSTCSGADHHGDVARLRGAAEALGFDRDAVEIVIYQWVAFLRDGEPVPDGQAVGQLHHARSADRRGRGRRREVPAAVVLQRRHDQLRHRGGEAAVDGQPRLLRAVRACAHRLDPRQGGTRGRDPGAGRARPTSSLLAHRGRDRPAAGPRRGAGTRSRTRRISGPRTGSRTPRRISRPASTASTRSAGSSPTTRRSTQARLWLAAGTKQVLANLLVLLGVSAPESMERADDDD